MHPQSESLEFIINKEDSGVFYFLVCNIILAKIKQTNKKIRLLLPKMESSEQTKTHSKL